MTPAYGCCPEPAPPLEPCSVCNFGTTPREMQVVIAGITLWGGPAPQACADCVTLNATYTLAHLHTCVWLYNFPSPVCGIDSIMVAITDVGGIGVLLRVTMSSGAAGRTIGYEVNVGPSPVDCGVSGLDVPLDEVVGPFWCQAGASTCTVTAL